MGATMKKAIYIIDGKNISVVIPENIEYRRLETLYDTCNELFKLYPECFYTKEQLQKLRVDPANNFIKNQFGEK